jgi:KDO2-lipid IV(A) lauroyltransferase
MARNHISKEIKRSLIYVFVCALVGFIRLLPRWSAIHVTRFLGRAAFFLIKSRRRRMIKHLTAAFGHEKSSEEINRIARQVFINIGTAAADAIRIPQISRNEMNKMITIEGREHLDREIKNGKSAMLLTAHFGNWELLAAWLARNGYKLKVVGTPNHDPRLDKLITDTRNSAGYFNISRGSSTRDIIRAIHDGYFMGMLIDQDTKVEGVFVKFFNQWAHTAIGPMVLARKYELNIIPIFIRLKSNFTYHIEVHEPLQLEFSENKDQDFIVNTQKCSDEYEKIIRRYPEQWVWFHKRWKKQPR